MDKQPMLSKAKTPEAYRKAQWVTEGFLIGAAQNRRVVTYAEVGRVIATATGFRIYGPSYGQFLGELSQSSHERYGVLLSALVVNSESLIPGHGFLELAKALGARRPGESDLKADHRLRAEVFKRFS